MNLSWLELARQNAPYLMVIAPLCAAALALASPSVRAAWFVACLAMAASAALGMDLAYRVLVAGAPANFAVIGVALKVDGAGAFAGPLIASVGLLVAIASGGLTKNAASARATPLLFALLLCVVAGWIGAVLADDFVALFLAAETAWLAGVGLVALSAERDRAALTGALRMLSAGGVAGALLLIGGALVYRGAGVIEIGPLSSAQIVAPNLCAAGIGLVLAALALKAGVAPLHLWVGAAYGRAGNLAALALGAIGAVGALSAFTRVATPALAAPAIGQGISAALVAVGAASVVIGSMQAIGARNLRRLAAYAGAAQAGCVLVSAALGSPAGVAATLVQILAQAAAAMAVLCGAGALGGSATIASLDGLARRAPLSSLAISAGALSLMGAPLTLGFLGRWRLIEAGVGGGWWWAAATVIVSSLAAVIYGGRLIERIYFRHATAATDVGRDWRGLALAPAMIVAIALIVLGVEPAELLRAADAAANLLTGEAP